MQQAIFQDFVKDRYRPNFGGFPTLKEYLAHEFPDWQIEFENAAMIRMVPKE